MNRNRIAGVVIALISIVALIFIIKGNLELSVLFMTALFAFTNGFRAVSFKEKGFEKEAKWMRGMSIFFAAGFVVMLILIFL